MCRNVYASIFTGEKSLYNQSEWRTDFFTCGSITNERRWKRFSANQSRASQALEWFTPVVLLHASIFTLLLNFRWFEYQASCDGSLPFALLKKIVLNENCCDVYSKQLTS